MNELIKRRYPERLIRRKKVSVNKYVKGCVSKILDILGDS